MSHTIFIICHSAFHFFPAVARRGRAAAPAFGGAFAAFPVGGFDAAPLLPPAPGGAALPPRADGAALALAPPDVDGALRGEPAPAPPLLPAIPLLGDNGSTKCGGRNRLTAPLPTCTGDCMVLKGRPGTAMPGIRCGGNEAGTAGDTPFRMLGSQNSCSHVSSVPLWSQDGQQAQSKHAQSKRSSRSQITH